MEEIEDIFRSIYFIETECIALREKLNKLHKDLTCERLASSNACEAYKDATQGR